MQPRRSRAGVASRVYTVDDICYDPVAHRSYAPDGREVPHVTGVLGAVGIATDFEALAKKLGAKMAADVEYARALGTAVHADCHAYDDDDLDVTRLDATKPYVEAWALCRADLGLTPIKRERRLFHPTQFYTGIEDGLFRTPDNRVVLGDIKIGDPEDSAAHLQTAAYEGAEKATDDAIVINERWAIHLDPALRIPYRIVNFTANRHDAWQDWGKWLSCLTVYREQPAQRKNNR